MALLNPLARPMLGWIFVSASFETLQRPNAQAEKARGVVDAIADVVPVFPRDPVTAVRLNAGAQMVAGAMLITGRMARAASLVLAASLVPTTIAGHAYWKVEDPTQRAQQKLHFQKNVALLGGLIFAATNTGGRPSVAWRARREIDELKERLPTVSAHP